MEHHAAIKMMGTIFFFWWELFSNGQCDYDLVLEHCTRKTMSDMVQGGDTVLPKNVY